MRSSTKQAELRRDYRAASEATVVADYLMEFGRNQSIRHKAEVASRNLHDLLVSIAVEMEPVPRMSPSDTAEATAIRMDQNRKAEQ